MKHKIHVLIPMSGQGTRYKAVGYTEPKPLIPVSGIPMIERLLSNFPEEWVYHFVVADNHKDSGLIELLKKIRPHSQVHIIGPHKQGPSYAMTPFLSEIPEQAPILVSYCDYGMVWDGASFERFVRSSDCDACLVSYRGFHAHYLSQVNYAFSRMEGERVVEVREKGNFTDNRENEFASGGAYYFKSRKMLQEAIDYQMAHDLQVNGEFYTSLTVEALLRMNKNAHVRIFEVPGFFQWGTPNDLQDFEYWEKTYSGKNRTAGLRGVTAQLLMPMAGFGSRFKTVSNKPKPLIELEKTPMFLKAVASLPEAKKNVYVTREDIVAELTRKQKENGSFVSLNYVPEGQALTTELGLPALDLEQEVLVSACDHGVVLDLSKWKRFSEKPQCDAAIFTVRGFPGTRRSPLSYSYVDVSQEKTEFPEVKSVFVKKTLSEKPGQDHLLVGTFWFKKASLLKKYIDELKTENSRVNGELYLDAIFNTMKKAGLNIRVFELDGYMNWGDPDSLKEALYWQEIFMGHSLSIRNPFPGVGL